MSLPHSRCLPQLAAGLAVVALAACGDSTVAPGGESELISRVAITLASTGAASQSAFIDDPDGNGPTAPSAQSGSLMLQPGVTYTGTIAFENRLENPPENITEEVFEESDEHRVFYTPSAGTTVTITDTDTQGRALGLQFTITAAQGTTGAGTLRAVLCHYVNIGKPSTATGCTDDTDIDVSFNYTVAAAALRAD